MAHLVLTLVGDDRAGLVRALADTVAAHDGNWERSELADVGGLKRVPVFHDLGSGALVDLGAQRLPEPTVASSIKAGADLVAFSGDKLLGGPQAGILVGRVDLVNALREHPLNRALRVDKLTVAALEATLELYQRGQGAQVPVLAALHESPEVVRRRGERLLGLLQGQGLAAELRSSEAEVGAGSSPLVRLPSCAAVLPGLDPERLAAHLRAGEPSVLGRVSEGMVWLDLRAIAESEVELLAQAVGRAVLSIAVPEGQG